MKQLLFICLLFAGLHTQAQDNQQQDQAPYLKVPYVPPFKLLLTDSTWYTKEDLPKKKPIVVIYFSPDCSHCQWEAQQIVDSMEYLSNAFFVFASYKKMPEIKEFAEKYKLLAQPNIKVGRDTAYFIPSFFRVKFTPFIGMYDEDGKFVKAFPKGATIEDLRAVLERKRKKKNS
jgi:thiol-disulfide isomerase/thioredoxin